MKQTILIPHIRGYNANAIAYISVIKGTRVRAISDTGAIYFGYETKFFSIFFCYRSFHYFKCPTKFQKIVIRMSYYPDNDLFFYTSAEKYAEGGPALKADPLVQLIE